MDPIKVLNYILCPPGDGVFTIETAKEKKQAVQKKLYGDQDPKREWSKSLDQISKHEGPFLLAVPSDNGGGILRGANWGPLFIRERLMKEDITNLFDLGDIRVVPHLLHDDYLNEITIQKVRVALYQEDLELPVSPLSISEKAVEAVLNISPQAKIFSLGGDHSVSAGLLPAIIRKHNDIGILHFDAHTDLLEERLGIDRCFATWAANILPSLKSPAHMVQVGIRRSSKDKAHWEKKFGLKQYWTKEVQECGANAVADDILEHFQNLNITKIYISFDIDAIDSEYASATGTPETDGIQPHDAAVILEKIGNKLEVIGADLVEVAPFINHYGSNSRTSPEPETTLDVATQLSLKILDLLNIKWPL